MPKGSFKDGVTRNKSTKCWLARIRRHKHNYSQYFFDKDWDDKESARQEALKWYANMLATLPPKISTKGIFTKRNKSGVVGVRLAKEVQNKPSGAQFIYWCWTANWPGCPKRGGVDWRTHVHGDNDSFVSAVLCRRMETTDKKRVHNALLAVKATSEYMDILKLKKQSAP